MHLSETSAVASIVATFLAVMAVIIAIQQVRIAKYGTDRHGLKINYSITPIGGDLQKIKATIHAAGPASFYELEVFLKMGNKLMKLSECLAEFNRNEPDIDVVKTVNNINSEDLELIIKWARGAGASEGLDDRLIKININTHRRYVWKPTRPHSLVHYWNGIILEKSGKDSPLLLRTGKWRRNRPSRNLTNQI